MVIKRNGLRQVKAIVKHSTFSSQRLETFGRELANFMMTPEGQEQLERNAKKTKIQREQKALRILIIV